MKIKLTDGSVVDTSKLNDMTAEVMERVENFTQFCARHKIPFILRMIEPTTKTYGGSQNFNDDPQDFQRVMDCLNYYFEHYKIPARIIPINER